MRETSDRWLSTLASSPHGVTTQAISSMTAPSGESRAWLLPLLAGSITYDATAKARRRATLVLPMIGPDGTRLYPDSNDYLTPVGTMGQNVTIHTGVVHADGTEELMNHGVYVMQDVDVDEEAGTVTVQCADLMTKLEAQKIVELGASKIKPPASYQAICERLTWVGLGAPTMTDYQLITPVFSPDLFPFIVGPSGVLPEIKAGDDRTAHWSTLTKTWGAEFYVNDDGNLYFGPAITSIGAPVATITAGAKDSTLISRGARTSRERMFNAVYVSGLNNADGKRVAYAEARVTSGWLSTGGDFGWVSRFEQSDQVQDQLSANRMATALLARGTLYTSTQQISAVPNAAIELNDSVRVESDYMEPFTGLVASIVLPLTAAGGPMQIDVTRDTGEITTVSAITADGPFPENAPAPAEEI